MKREAFASNELLTVKLRYKPAKRETSELLAKSLFDEEVDIRAASENTRFSAAVAEFGMLLRDSKFKGKSSFTTCLALARESSGADLDGYRAEFISLIEKSAALRGDGQRARLDR